MGLRADRPREIHGCFAFRRFENGSECSLSNRSWEFTVMSPIAYVLSLPVRAYRVLLSPLVGKNCRYDPTCSAYALEALERHGALKGSWLAIRRIMRCHPWGGSGVDDVPK